MVDRAVHGIDHFFGEPMGRPITRMAASSVAIAGVLTRSRQVHRERRGVPYRQVKANRIHRRWIDRRRIAGLPGSAIAFDIDHQSLAGAPTPLRRAVHGERPRLYQGRLKTVFTYRAKCPRAPVFQETTGAGRHGGGGAQPEQKARNQWGPASPLGPIYESAFHSRIRTLYADFRSTSSNRSSRDQRASILRIHRSHDR